MLNSVEKFPSCNLAWSKPTVWDINYDCKCRGEKLEGYDQWRLHLAMDRPRHMLPCAKQGFLVRVSDMMLVVQKTTNQVVDPISTLSKACSHSKVHTMSTFRLRRSVWGWTIVEKLHRNSSNNLLRLKKRALLVEGMGDPVITWAFAYKG